MQEYKMFNFKDNIYEDVIFINNTEDLYFLYDSIYEAISVKRGNNFTVLVDLFLRNGFTFNRFIAVTYNGKEDVKTSIVNPRDVSEEIKNKINAYLNRNQSILECSSLSKNTIDFVINRKSTSYFL